LEILHATTYLESLTLLRSHVGYGELGLHGDLGYEGKAVAVQGRFYPHALSTHAPARLQFSLDGRFSSFRCRVALNDDVPAGESRADFSVLADGRYVAFAPCVTPKQAPREIVADVRRAQNLELAVTTRQWEFCHAVWLDPQVDEELIPGNRLRDCLGRAEIEVPQPLPRAKDCIATVASPGFAQMLDDALGSLAANGCCPQALIAVFLVGTDPECERVIAKNGATLIRCRPYANFNATLKSILYSSPLVIDAARFACIDADTLVLGDLRPLFAALEACPAGSILACREGNGYGYKDLGHALNSIYGGRDSDLSRMLGKSEDLRYPLVVNDGLFAGTRGALLALDSLIRSMPQAVAWTDQRRDIAYRNQFIFNLALARLDCGVELDPVYNVQLNTQDVKFELTNGGMQALWRGAPSRVLHFNGCGRHKYPEWRGLYASVANPLVGRGGGDGYAAFLEVLRTWVGKRGLGSLAWSFYGTTDGINAHVKDPDVFPLLALLHYLIRSNGCARVLETGTARGVSAACLASAVAHRANARVVTLDPERYDGREELWAALPEGMKACIDPRQAGSIEGMAASLDAGEQYEAVLLDSIHTEEHVWAEFDLARQLVCPGGLILIHDVCYVNGTVRQVIPRIEAAGYGVTRLWAAAETRSPEDDNLGLAVIENRRRERSDA
jgi:predicted O-methyltransferase YrrM